MNRTFFIAGVLVLLIVIGLFVAISWMTDDAAPTARSGGPETWDAQTRREVQRRHEEIDEHMSRANFPGVRLLAMELIDDYPGDPQAYVYLAQAAMGQKQWQVAYDAAQQAVQRDPELHEIHFLAGVLAEKLDKNEAAASHYLQAMEVNDSAAKYPLYLANLYLRTNQLDEAQLYALRVLRLDPSIPQAYALLARIAGRQGKIDMALDQINRAIKLAPADSKDRYAYTLQRVRLLRRAGVPEREEALNALLALPEAYRTQRREVTEELAQTYLSLERPGDAAEVWSAWVERHPGDAAASAETGLALLRAGETQTARDYLELAQRIKPHDPKVQALAKALADHADPGKAGG